MDEAKLRVLLTQYRELWTTIREYDKLIWQTPQYMGIVVGAIVAVTFGYLSNFPLIQIILLFFSLFLTFTLWITAHKHNFFRTIFFRKWENTIDEIEKITKIRPVMQEKTSHYFEEIDKGIIPDIKPILFPHHLPYKRTAYKWLFASIYFIMFAICIMIFGILQELNIYTFSQLFDC